MIEPMKKPSPKTRVGENQARSFTMSLHALLTSRSGIGATDSRDLIYANLGVVEDLDVCQKYIAVDYFKTIEAVFCERGVYLLEACGFDHLISETLVAEIIEAP